MNSSPLKRTGLTSFGRIALVACAILFAESALASPPPPPPLPVLTKMGNFPNGNHLGRQYVIRMRIWYNDTIVYDGASAYGTNFPDQTSAGRFHKGGTIKTELAILDLNGKMLASDSRTKTRGFEGATNWLGGQVYTPDRKGWISWQNFGNYEGKGYLRFEWNTDWNVR